MIGTMCVPDGIGDGAGATVPGIVVFHEGPGLDDHAIGRAERLAELGCIAFAADYHGGGTRPPFDEMRTRVMGLLADRDRTRAIARAGFDVLLAEPGVDVERTAAIGFCFGGTTALELGRSGAPVQAIVGFHSGLSSPNPADAANIVGSVLVCIGADDPMVPVEERLAFEEEMRAAGGVDYRINVYGGAVHSFTNPAADAWGAPGIAYHRPTDERSWRAMLDLFEERFGEV